MSEVPGVYRVGNVLMVSFPCQPLSTFTPPPPYLPRPTVSSLTLSIRPENRWPVVPFVAFSVEPKSGH